MPSHGADAFYKRKKILVTGAGGYIGSAVAAALSRIDCDLRLSYHSTLSGMPKDAVANIQSNAADISAPGAWSDIAGIDVVFHFAEHNYQDIDPHAHLQTSALPVLNLLEECRRQNLRPKIIFASSSNLAGNPDKLPVDDTAADRPLTMYAIHKLLAEEYLRHYAREFGIESVTLRLVNVYGPPANPSIALRVVLNSMVHAAMGQGFVKLFKNRSCVRDFIYIDDVVSAFLAAGALDTRGSAERFIIGTGEGVTLQDMASMLAQKLSKLSGKHTAVEPDDTQEVSGVEMRNLVADSGRFRRMSGWKPQVPLGQGIEKTVAYFISHT